MDAWDSLAFANRLVVQAQCHRNEIKRWLMNENVKMSTSQNNLCNAQSTWSNKKKLKIKYHWVNYKRHESGVVKWAKIVCVIAEILLNWWWRPLNFYSKRAWSWWQCLLRSRCCNLPGNGQRREEWWFPGQQATSSSNRRSNGSETFDPFHIHPARQNNRLIASS